MRVSEGEVINIHTNEGEVINIHTIEGLRLAYYALLLGTNLVPRAMPVRGLGWHWLWGN
jgi:hypothetical protein